MSDPIESLKDSLLEILRDRDIARDSELYVYGALGRIYDALREATDQGDWARVFKVQGTIEGMIRSRKERAEWEAKSK